MTKGRCIVCGGETALCLDLGVQPLANHLIENSGDEYEKYNLGFERCTNCTHGQLTEFVPPSLLFRNYLYASGTSRTLDEYFAWFADAIGKPSARYRSVLEIASNDGSLLNHLAKRGYEVTGIDPAANLTAIAEKSGHRVVADFFPSSQLTGKFDIIIAMNVAAHTPTPFNFMQGVAASLTREGIAIIQTSQAMMLSNGEFDTIYHEHYSFYTVASMKHLAERAGMRLERVRLSSIHGISSLFFLRHRDSPEAPFNFACSTTYSIPLPESLPSHLSETFPDAEQSYEIFATKADALMKQVQSRVMEFRQMGRKIALIGVAAKAMTFINASGIRPDMFFDEAPLKVDRYIPGFDTPIRSFSSIADLDCDIVFFIGAWNFADEIMKKVRSIAKIKPSFLIHFPNMREV